MPLKEDLKYWRAISWIKLVGNPNAGIDEAVRCKTSYNAIVLPWGHVHSELQSGCLDYGSNGKRYVARLDRRQKGSKEN